MRHNEGISGLLQQLGAADPQQRDRAAAALGDLLEGGALSENDYRTAVAALLRAATTEPDEVARESVYNALSSAATGRGSWRVDWGPVAAQLAELSADCLEHALVILGFSGDPKYREAVAGYVCHSDPAVRDAAADALKILGGREPQPRAKAR